MELRKKFINSNIIDINYNDHNVYLDDYTIMDLISLSLVVVSLVYVHSILA
jgi:hypothetical protein